MSVNSQKYIIQNMERLSYFDLTDGSCLFVADDLQEAEMTNEQETVYATGKNGVRIGSGDRNKASRITATNGAIVDGILAVQTGTAVAVGTNTVKGWIDELTVANNSDTPAKQIATVTHKPKGSTGAEIKFIYKRNTDGSLGSKYGIEAVADATHFSFNPTTGVITCPTDVFVSGDKIIAIYDFEVANAKKFTNAENKFSMTGMLVADIFAKDICTDKSYYGKIIYSKAKASGNFNLAFGNDPSVQNMEFEALSGGCGGSSKVLWDMYIFDDEDITDIV